MLGQSLTLAGKLPGTSAQFRAGILRESKVAIIAVAPAKAVKRRQDAARNARVERWPEDSGNAGLAGRELPPADVLAADQRVTWWAKQLKGAGLDGDMDQLRARAFLDILLNRDSRTAQPGNPGTAVAPSGRQYTTEPTRYPHLERVQQTGPDPRSSCA